MDKCKVCGKTIFFWNKFKRKYGIPKAIINNNWKKPIDYPFCSMKCFSFQSNFKYSIFQDWFILKEKTKDKKKCQIKK
jgi:hypothetical protein